MRFFMSFVWKFSFFFIAVTTETYTLWFAEGSLTKTSLMASKPK